jgi:hypothetical protein
MRRANRRIQYRRRKISQGKQTRGEKKEGVKTG